MKRSARSRGAGGEGGGAGGLGETPPSNPQEAFARYVLPEVGTLLRVALSLTRHHADAEDLVQDTLLRAYRSIASFDGRHPRAWLFTILRNTNINRARKRRPALMDDPDETLSRLPNDPAAGADVEEAVVGTTFEAVVQSAFNDLPDVFRSVVELVDLGGLSYEEAAETLGVPVGTVMSRLHRARRRMRARLEETGVAPERRSR